MSFEHESLERDGLDFLMWKIYNSDYFLDMLLILSHARGF
jgi:hypothetical protein